MVFQERKPQMFINGWKKRYKNNHYKITIEKPRWIKFTFLQ